MFRFQYFNKYCAPDGDKTATRNHWSVSNMISRWWQSGSVQGLVIDAGVDERLIRGLSKEVQGFSGREVGKEGFAPHLRVRRLPMAPSKKSAMSLHVYRPYSITSPRKSRAVSESSNE